MADARIPNLGRKRLALDGEWTLLELSGFGRQYVQIYSFLYVVRYRADIPEEDVDERVLHAFRAFPWAGGWSAVDFYESLRSAVPKRHRPRIATIRYASPGYIDLALAIAIAWTISRTVRHVCESIKQVNGTYHQIYSDAKQRQLLGVNVRRAEFELRRDELEFAEKAGHELAAAIGFKRMDELRQLTTNPVVRLKMLMSLYRRIRHLAKLQNSGNIRF